MLRAGDLRRNSGLQHWRLKAVDQVSASIGRNVHSLALLSNLLLDTCGRHLDLVVEIICDMPLIAQGAACHDRRLRSSIPCQRGILLKCELVPHAWHLVISVGSEAFGVALAEDGVMPRASARPGEGWQVGQVATAGWTVGDSRGRPLASRMGGQAATWPASSHQLGCVIAPRRRTTLAACRAWTLARITIGRCRVAQHAMRVRLGPTSEGSLCSRMLRVIVLGSSYLIISLSLFSLRARKLVCVCEVCMRGVCI